MNRLARTGLGVSLLGAVVDFGSGYSYSMAPMGPPAGMTGSTGPISIALFLLGIVVLSSGALIVLPRMAGSMRGLGLLMEALGVVMALVSYLVPGMNLALSYAMLLVGAAMILNGALMQRRGSSMEHS